MRVEAQRKSTSEVMFHFYLEWMLIVTVRITLCHIYTFYIPKKRKGKKKKTKDR